MLVMYIEEYVTNIRWSTRPSLCASAIVLGSVAFHRDGARIGKGAGYRDVEFTLLTEADLVTPATVVVTTVHALLDRLVDPDRGEDRCNPCARGSFVSGRPEPPPCFPESSVHRASRICVSSSAGCRSTTAPTTAPGRSRISSPSADSTAVPEPSTSW